MVEPKTVSNLPLDVSIRWSQDQQLLQETQPLTRDAATVSSLAKTDTPLPLKPSEFEALLGLTDLHPSWAAFQMPPHFFSQRRQIFRSQLIPFLGSDEQQDSLIARIQNAKGSDEDRDTWESEKGCLLKLFEQLQTLNKDLIDILTRLIQYQKG
jgi:hypothetical protein